MLPDNDRDKSKKTRAKGRAQAAAREMGVEMVDADRLANMLMDLQREGVINPDRVMTEAELEEAAVRGIEILRG